MIRRREAPGSRSSAERNSESARTLLEPTDVLVIGGGVVGCSTAYELARNGIDVVLVERGQLNREASGTNAGNVHIQLLSQYAVSPPGDNEALVASGALHAESLNRWRGLEEELGSDLGLRLAGGLMVAETAEQMDAVEDKCKLEKLIGLETTTISGAEVLALEPALSPQILGAGYCAAEGFANPLLVAPAFACRARELGARILVETEVRSIAHDGRSGFAVETSRGRLRASRVINASGSWSGRVAAMLGVELPIDGGILQVHVTEPWPPLLKHVVQHIARRLTLKQTQYGTFIIGGGWKGADGETSSTARVRRQALMGNTWVAANVLPPLEQVNLIRSWTGIIPRLQGRVAIVGECPGVRGFYIGAVGATGFTIAPVVGRVLAELLSGLKPSLNIDPFHPNYSWSSAGGQDA